MRIGSGTAAVIAITLIAAGSVHGDSLGPGQSGLSAWLAAVGATGGAVDAVGAARGASGATRAGKNRPSAAPSTPAATPPGTSPTGTPAVVLDDQEVSGIVGKSVRSNADEDMGRIVDIIVNQDGHVRAAIIDFGGFLGIGTRKIAVDWRALKFSPRQAGRDHAGAHPQSGEGGAGIQTRRAVGRAGPGGPGANHHAVDRRCNAGEVTLAIGPAPRDPREPNRRRVEGGRHEPDYPRTSPARTAPPQPPIGASRRSQRALDWFTFFVADVQTGFGPFISVYLTTHQWTQVDIGLVLTAGGLAALAFQMPGGLLLDAVRSERRVARSR